MMAIDDLGFEGALRNSLGLEAATAALDDRVQAIHTKAQAEVTQTIDLLVSNRTPPLNDDWVINPALAAGAIAIDEAAELFQLNAEGKAALTEEMRVWLNSVGPDFTAYYLSLRGQLAEKLKEAAKKSKAKKKGRGTAGKSRQPKPKTDNS